MPSQIVDPRISSLFSYERAEMCKQVKLFLTPELVWGGQGNNVIQCVCGSKELSKIQRASNS